MPMLHQHDHTLRMKHQRALQLLPWAQDLEDFPGGSDGKESAYIVGDLSSIPGSGRSLGEGNGNPFQYSGQENSMDRGAWWTSWFSGKQSACNAGATGNVGSVPGLEEMVTHSSILAWSIPWTDESGGLQSMGLQRVRHD